MYDSHLKKIVVITTIAVLLALWLFNRPSSITAVTSEISYKYIVHETKNSGTINGKLIFALHGNGDKITNFRDTLFHGIDLPGGCVFIQGPFKYRQGYSWPMNGPDLKTYGDALAEVIKKLTEKYGNNEKPVLVGFSGGGCMAYYQAAVHPDLFSSIIPIAGRLDSSVIQVDDTVEDASVKISVLHGNSDSVINIMSGRSAVAFLEKIGRDVTFTEINGGHLAVFTGEHAIFKEILMSSLD